MGKASRRNQGQEAEWRNRHPAKSGLGCLGWRMEIAQYNQVGMEIRLHTRGICLPKKKGRGKAGSYKRFTPLLVLYIQDLTKPIFLNLGLDMSERARSQASAPKPPKRFSFGWQIKSLPSKKRKSDARQAAIRGLLRSLYYIYKISLNLFF